MNGRIAEIRRRVARAGRAAQHDFDELDDVRDSEGPSAELLILRGQLIRLVADGREDDLEEAFFCFEGALVLDPHSASAHEEIGHFLDDVAEQPEDAVTFFRKAIELGAGASAEDALRDVLGRLGDAESDLV